MHCPFCLSENTKVADSRTSRDVVKRRRECLSCKERFTTIETIDLYIQVKKRDGRYEEFSQEKIARGMEIACLHSRIGPTQVRAIANEVTNVLLHQQGKEVDSQTIGQMVMDRLIDYDPVAYIRFACVYFRFNLSKLKEMIQKISPSIDNDSHSGR